MKARHPHAVIDFASLSRVFVTPASIPTRTLHTLRIAIKLLRLLAVLQSPFVQLASFGFDKRNLCLSGSNLGGFGPRHTAVANDK